MKTTRTPKDPSSMVARNYQMEMFEKAKNENTIVFLKTGSGKTFVSILLLKHLASVLLSNGEDRKWGVFLCDNVPMVDQQADEIAALTEFNVGRYVGEMKVDYWDKQKWAKEIESNHVLVMTGAIFLDLLRHSGFHISRVSVLIFDECHHTVKNHPYHVIMNEFYHHERSHGFVLPKILGMTSVIPEVKIQDSEIEVKAKIKAFESRLASKLYTTSFTDELESHISKPKISVREYIPYDMPYGELVVNDPGFMKDKSLVRMLGAINYTYRDLGLWCTLRHIDLILTDIGDKLKNPAQYQQLKESGEYDALQTRIQHLNSLKIQFNNKVGNKTFMQLKRNQWRDQFFSPKILQLLFLLEEMAGKEGFCGIIFVERRDTARILCDLMEVISKVHFNNFFASAALVGRGTRLQIMKITEQRKVVMDFRDGTINLLVATRVAEEGLDIQPCNLVIQSEGIKSIQSFIQSRGRARHGDSCYAILYEKGDMKQFKNIEGIFQMENKIKSMAWDPTEDEDENEDEEGDGSMIFDEHYSVPSTAAIVTLQSSVSLLYRYCSKLPGDRYYRTFIEFGYEEDSDCQFTSYAKLPPNSPLREPIFGKKYPKRYLARKSAALAAVIRLYEVEKELDDNLLPKEVKLQVVEQIPLWKPIKDMSETVSYEKFVPQAFIGKWNLEKMETQKFYIHSVSLFTITTMDGGFQHTNNPKCLGIATLQRFDELTFTLFVDEHTKVLVTLTYCEEMTVDQKALNLAKNFHLSLFKFVARRPVPPHNNETNRVYLVVPLKEEAHVDWEVIEKANLKQPFKMFAKEFPHDQLTNKILTTTYNNVSYLVTKVDTDLTIHDTMPEIFGKELPENTTFKDYYECRRGITIQDQQQQLVKVMYPPKALNFVSPRKNKIREEWQVYLVPELCVVEAMSADMALQGCYIPSVIYKLENLLLGIDILNQTHVSVPLDLVLEARTLSSTCEGFCYQRLEVLGDAALKFLTAVHVFFEYPSKHEGVLSKMKDNIVCNSALCYYALQKQMYGYFSIDPFKISKWQPAGYTVQTTQKIGKKNLADIIEALLGVFFLKSSLKSTLELAEWFGLPLSWWAFQKYQEQTANKKPQLPDHYVEDVARFSKKINYTFKNLDILLEAFTHTSFTGAKTYCYQRLEFLGDAILDAVVAKYIYKHWPSLDQGQLSDMKQAIVSNEVFGRLAYDNGYHKFLKSYSSFLFSEIRKYGRGIKQFTNSNGTNEGVEDDTPTESNFSEILEVIGVVEAPKVLGDLWESVAAAIFIDCGLDLKAFWKIYKPMMLPVLQGFRLTNIIMNPIRVLCEKLQTLRPGTYVKWRTEPPKFGEFAKAEVIVNGEVIGFDDTATNIRGAKKRAAKKAMKHIVNNPNFLESLGKENQPMNM